MPLVSVFILCGGGPALQFHARTRRSERVVEEERHVVCVRAAQVPCRPQYGDGTTLACAGGGAVTHPHYLFFLWGVGS